jgi:hypothetical protein
MNRARFVRNLITEAVDGAPVEAPEHPSYDELLDLLAEKARQGNVSAIRSLLAREEYEDPGCHSISGWSSSSIAPTSRRL